MRPKAKEYRNGWSCHMERVGAWYLVNVRDGRGDVHDKVRCDEYRDGLDYWRAFNAIARNA
jgi:hypothetical protein